MSRPEKITGEDTILYRINEAEDENTKLEAPLVNVEVLVGKQVLELLSDSLFLKKWDLLYDACPWVTIYQRKDFVISWYKTYSELRLPLLVRADYGNELIGLLTLSKKNNLIKGIGEYHVWISTVFNSNTFIEEAITEIWRKFPGADFQFRFLPGTTPLEWITSQQWKKKCLLLRFSQPIMEIDEAYVSQELRKKNRREKINRLKRLGHLEFEHITDKVIFSKIFDDIAAQYDFRKGALYNKSRFTGSPLARQSLFTLFDLGLLHVSVLKLDNEIIASNVGTIAKPWIHLSGMNTHSPVYSKYSPGILHFLMLCKSLAEEGYESFDLTPGGESYKDSLASRHAVAYELRIAGSIKYYLQSVITKKADDYISNGESVLNRLSKAGILPDFPRYDKLKALRKYFIYMERLRNAKQNGVGSFIKALVPYPRGSNKYILYRTKARLVKDNNNIIQKDNLQDLLKYKPVGRDLTRNEFLSDAMGKLESGHHVYTVADSDLLHCSVWLKNQLNSTEADFGGKSNSIEEGSLILFNNYCHPQMRHKIEDFIKAAVYKSTSDNMTNSTYIAVNKTDIITNDILQKAGFIEKLN